MKSRAYIRACLGADLGRDPPGAGGPFPRSESGTRRTVVRFGNKKMIRASLAFPVLLALASCALFGNGRPDYVVFFQERSVALDPAARDVIAHAARRAQESPTAAVQVIGYTDSAGSPQADVTLSQRRAQAVADALVANGVSPSRLVRLGRGQTGSNAGVMSRRVEIFIPKPSVG
jgi:hypothetical protein